MERSVAAKLAAALAAAEELAIEQEALERIEEFQSQQRSLSFETDTDNSPLKGPSALNIHQDNDKPNRQLNSLSEKTRQAQERLAEINSRIASQTSTSLEDERTSSEQAL